MLEGRKKRMKRKKAVSEGRKEGRLLVRKEGIKDWY